MERLELSDNEIMSYISNKDKIVGAGMFGILYEYDKDTLLKLYYHEFLSAYFSLDLEDFKKDMEINLKLKKYDDDLRWRKERLIKLYESLKKTSSRDLLKGIIINRDYIIGVILTYYRDYFSLMDYYNSLSDIDKRKVLIRCRDLLKELMDNNIYPGDISEKNIVVNRNLDVKIIDLDGYDVRVEEKQYVDSHPHIIKMCENKIIEMEYRLKYNYGIIL